MKFTDFPLSPHIQQAIADMGFIEPTPVQEQVIPFVLDTDTRDLVALSQTGTGKTAAFGLPLLERIDFSRQGPQVLILCPTRELCMQIYRDFMQFSAKMRNPGIVAVYGGAAYGPQIRELRSGARIIIATPGRLRDLIEKGEAELQNLAYLILDEADTMLNMGFKEELDEILSFVHRDKQTLLFSATMPPEVARIAENYMTDPQEITMGIRNAGAVTVEHRYYMVHAKDKFQALKRLADYYPGIYGIVFCRTRAMARELAEKLIKEGYNADALHGDLSQQQRESVMKKFRENNLHMLVATDIAARGLDVQDLTHVIHYDLPDELEIYTHRSGRTGRAGKSGLSLAIIHMRERHKIRRIEQLIHKKITETAVPGGKEICEQQLLDMIDRITSTDVDDSKIAPFLPIIEQKLEGVDAHMLVKQVLSLEFNRFLKFYGNVPDLSSVETRKKPSRERDAKRSSRESGKSDYAGDFIWMTINLGRSQQFGKTDLIGLINSSSDGRSVELGKIVSEKTFTRFQVRPEAGDQLIRSLSRISVRGKRLRVKAAADIPYQKSGSSRSRGRTGSSKNYGGTYSKRSSTKGKKR